MNNGDTAKAQASTTWHQGEHQSLVTHFEEVYKLGVTSFSIVTAGSGAILALIGGKLPTNLLGIAAVPLIVWWAVLFKPLRFYTLHVLDRLANIERAMGCPGHFYNWDTKVKKKTYGIFQTGTGAMDGFIIAVLILAIWTYFAGDKHSHDKPIKIIVTAKISGRDPSGQQEAILDKHYDLEERRE